MGSARDRLLGNLASRGDHLALVQEGCRWTYAQLDAGMRAWGSDLREAGVGTGDRVAVLAPSSPQLIAAMLGAYAIGAVWVPINTRYREAEVGHILEDAKPSLLLCDPALREAVPTSSPVPVRDLEARPTASLEIEALSDDAPAMLVYTSGTTGRSKGATLSHSAVVEGIAALTGLWGWSHRDVLSLQLPLFHVHGLCIGVHGALLAGMSMLIHAKFSARAVVDDVAQRGASIFMGVPTMYTRLLAHLDANPTEGDSLRGARLFTAGSAALPASDLEAFERHTGHRILERYGMSETLITFSNPLLGERRPGSVGREVPGVRSRVVDEHGSPVEPGVVGELQVQTPAMMSAYWKNPEATTSSFDGPWFRTGDVVQRDADGYLRIVGRMSVDIIKSGGFKISAREIEEVLLLHPAVAEVAVVGLPDETWGERIEAAVVLVDSLPDAQEALVAHALAALADYKKPRAVHVVDTLPRNALGKLQKVALKRQLQAR
ncbi:MAG: class I adenylate-forming enzyme family protein [Nannocystales bacterium]